ncbi:MAG: hypothetical protein ACOX8L_01320 [Candidatus Methanomethylophilaceae archaeon]|jgi:hypothetical protein
MDFRRGIIENGKYAVIWTVMCLAGIIVMLTGTFGVIGLAGIPASGSLFAAGAVMIVFSAAIIFYNSHRLGLLGGNAAEVPAENKKRISHHKRKK